MKSVLITGCSSGIGLATAKLLKKNQWNVFATARNSNDLSMLTEHNFNAVPLDIANTASVINCVNQVVEKSNGTICAVVNNAGFGLPGAIEDLTRQSMIEQFEVNFFGLFDLTNRLIPYLIKKEHARIVNISSVVGRVAIPFMGIYSASKFALEAATDAQRIELGNTSVRVSLIQPGPITSKFSAHCLNEIDPLRSDLNSRFNMEYRKYYQNRYSKKIIEEKFRLPPDAVASKVLHALESRYPKIRYKVTLPAYIMDFCVRFLPASYIDGFFKNKISSYIK